MKIQGGRGRVLRFAVTGALLGGAAGGCTGSKEQPRTNTAHVPEEVHVNAGPDDGSQQPEPAPEPDHVNVAKEPEPEPTPDGTPTVMVNPAIQPEPAPEPDRVNTNKEPDPPVAKPEPKHVNVRKEPDPKPPVEAKK